MRKAEVSDGSDEARGGVAGKRSTQTRNLVVIGLVVMKIVKQVNIMR